MIFSYLLKSGQPSAGVDRKKKRRIARTRQPVRNNVMKEKNEDYCDFGDQVTLSFGL